MNGFATLRYCIENFRNYERNQVRGTRRVPCNDKFVQQPRWFRLSRLRARATPIDSNLCIHSGLYRPTKTVKFASFAVQYSRNINVYIIPDIECRCTGTTRVGECSFVPRAGRGSVRINGGEFEGYNGRNPC